MRRLDDWLAHYMRYTDNTEPPKLYHLWTGLMAISSCLQRKCYLPWGHDTIYPNLFAVLVGPPGGRKGTAMKIGKGMLQTLGLSLAPDCVTVQQLYKEIAANEAKFEASDGSILDHKSLSIWSEEFSVFLGSQNTDMIVALTDLFDCPDTWQYATKNKGQDDLSNTYVSLYGAITPKILQAKLTQEAVGGGMISRIIFVVGYGKIKYVPLPFLSKEDYALHEDLLYDLAQIQSFSGTFKFTERALETYANWYINPQNSRAISSEHFVGYNERRALHLRKLCMIVSAAETNKMIITEDHFHKALAILERTEVEMPNAFFGLGRGDHAQTMSEIMLLFQTRNEVSWSELLERFQLDSTPEQLHTLTSMLETTGRIKKEKSISGGVKLVNQSQNTSEQKEDILTDSIFQFIE